MRRLLLVVGLAGCSAAPASRTQALSGERVRLELGMPPGRHD